jgi:hypothetical protein
MQTSAASPRLAGTLNDALSKAGRPLLFGLRMWASVCLALFVAFWLDLSSLFVRPAMREARRPAASLFYTLRCTSLGPTAMQMVAGEQGAYRNWVY